jgi:flagellar basal-body rod protein FlgF
MNRGIYATATGMIAAQKWMDVVSNNLANVSTSGFKRDDVAFRDVMVREMRSGGGRGSHLGSLGSGVILDQEFTIFERGSITPTGNPLDVAIDSDTGLFAVQTPNGVRYTRDGAFQLDSNRRLVTKTGHAVLDDRGSEIELPLGTISISGDGTVSVDNAEVGKLGVYDGSFKKIGDNLFASATANAIDGPTLKPGSIESSNVNVVEAMITLISVNRTFEMSQKNITQQDELTQRLIQSLQDR